MELSNLIKKTIVYLVKQKWFLFGFLPGVIVIGLAFVLFAGHFLMAYPGICLHCHVNQTKIEMWSQSVHPDRVTCVNCHAEPGQLFPHKFSAKSEFVNKNCLHCHNNIEKKEQQISNDIKFSHRLHIQEAELTCVDCHRNIVHEKMLRGTNKPSHATCVECHEEVKEGGREACLKCHI
jgi:nitrate/TMAO reductase-like tetraheme cytochrome c subunit